MLIGVVPCDELLPAEPGLLPADDELLLLELDEPDDDPEEEPLELDEELPGLVVVPELLLPDEPEPPEDGGGVGAGAAGVVKLTVAPLTAGLV